MAPWGIPGAGAYPGCCAYTGCGGVPIIPDPAVNISWGSAVNEIIQLITQIQLMAQIQL